MVIDNDLIDYVHDLIREPDAVAIEHRLNAMSKKDLMDTCRLILVAIESRINRDEYLAKLKMLEKMAEDAIEKKRSKKDGHNTTFALDTRRSTGRIVSLQGFLVPAAQADN